MALDFSGLNALATRHKPSDALEGQISDQTAQADNYASKEEKPAYGQNTRSQSHMDGRAHNLLTAEAAERERMRQMYADYQKAIKQSQTITANILHGMVAGMQTLPLLLQAIKAISLMTGNSVVYDTAEDLARTVYGRGMQNVSALDAEITETQRELNKLQESAGAEGLKPDERRKILTAIDAHREWLHKLEADRTQGQTDTEREASA